MPKTPEARTLRQALIESRVRLKAKSDSPKSDAEWLWGHALRRSRAWILAHPEWALTAAQQSRGESLIRRRMEGYSVAHLLGECGFLNLTLRLNSRVLAPRPETELLALHAMRMLPRRSRILEWGTGSGAISLALAQARPDCRILALDHSRAALGLARSNALRLRLWNLRLARADWQRAWPAGKFDLILANPPYVAPHDPHLKTPGVLREPRHALVAQNQGMQSLRVLAAKSRKSAHHKTQLLLEHGATQGATCRRIVARAGWGRPKTLRDLAGLQRACLSTHRPLKSALACARAKNVGLRQRRLHPLFKSSPFQPPAPAR